MRPPQHAIDARPILVLSTDPAWDLDRIEREQKEHEGPHPVAEYLSGLTRFDISAPVQYAGREVSAAEYLEDGAVRFLLRRLTVHQVAELRDLIRRSSTGDGDPSYAKAWTLCAKYGLAGCDAVNFRERGGAVSDSTLGEIYDGFGGLEAVTEIGGAVWLLSAPLSDAEKKA